MKARNARVRCGWSAKPASWGTVTCLSVDTVNHRAWIGGVLTKVESDNPAARQVGEDV